MQVHMTPVMKIDNKEVAYLEGEKNPLEAMEQLESKLEEMREDLLWATKEIRTIKRWIAYVQGISNAQR